MKCSGPQHKACVCEAPKIQANHPIASVANEANNAGSSSIRGRLARVSAPPRSAKSSLARCLLYDYDALVRLHDLQVKDLSNQLLQPRHFGNLPFQRVDPRHLRLTILHKRCELGVLPRQLSRDSGQFHHLRVDGALLLLVPCGESGQGDYSPDGSRLTNCDASALPSWRKS